MSFESFIQTEQFYHFFQPIFHLENGRKVGYEALLRSESYPNPEITFEMAKNENKLFELDSRSIHKAISSFDSAGSSINDEILFLNTLPSTVLHPDFSRSLNELISGKTLNKECIVLEISESEAIQDLELFKNQLFQLRQDGYLIAIDDIGKGYSSVELIIEMEPDYLKMDRYFAKDLHISKNKQEFISVFKDFCDSTSIQMILEGVEKEEELETAKSLGVSYAQGYFLGKPALLKGSLVI